MMYLYYLLASVAGLVAGIIIAARSKKADGVVYGALDKVGIATNILLIPVYAVLSTFFLFLVMLGMNPGGEGFIWVISLIVALIGASGTALCGLGLGASVALRKNGKSKLSFAAQFAGLIYLAIAIALFLIFYGNLLAPLN